MILSPVRLNGNAMNIGVIAQSQLLGTPGVSYSMQVTGLFNSGRQAATSWTVNLEGSNDNLSWDIILQHTDSAPGDGNLVFSNANKLTTNYVRINVAALNLGPATSILISVAGA